jgi:hypothetical protein
VEKIREDIAYKLVLDPLVLERHLNSGVNTKNWNMLLNFLFAHLCDFVGRRSF